MGEGVASRRTSYEADPSPISICFTTIEPSPARGEGICRNTVPRQERLALRTSARRAGVTDYASTSHFFMKLAFAAPDSFLPSLLTALTAQLSRLHFLRKLVFAAPASGLP